MPDAVVPFRLDVPDAALLRTELDGGGPDGLGVHLLHVRSPHPDALPLVLTHGWPGSVVEFLKVIGPLTRPPDPRDAFHVVVPSLPGYGFSDRPARRGWTVERIATAWARRRCSRATNCWTT